MKTTSIPFNIMSKKLEPVLFTESIPDFFKEYEMMGADHIIAFGSFGHLSIQEYRHKELPITIRYINSLATKDESFVFSNSDADLKLHFALKNSFYYTEEGSNIKELQEGSFNMFYVPVVNVEQTMEANRLYSSLSIHFNRSYLETWCTHYPLINHFLAKIREGIPAILCDANQITSVQMDDIIKQLISNKYDGVARSLYIDIKIKELFMLVMDKVSNYPTPCYSALSKTEIEQFSEAKEVLLSNMQKPMSLKQMSRKFGINTKKIKTGFKQLYEMTPFNLLFITRMEKAKAMLTCSELDIATIADEIGYDNKHSFSKAFKKYFGYPPGRCRKNNVEQTYKYSHN